MVDTLTRSDLNMASTLMHLAPQPELFVIGNNVEQFIEDTERFFDFGQIKEEQRNIFVKAFLSVPALKKYEAELKANAKRCYKDILISLFKKKTSFYQDMIEALEYRKGTDSVEDFFEKIEKLTEKVFSYDVTKESFKLFLIDNCLDDAEMKKDLKMQDLKNQNDIKERMAKLEKVQNELNNQINGLKKNIRSYGETFKPEESFASRVKLNNTNYRRNERYNKNETKQNTCTTCNKPGKIDYNNRNNRNYQQKTKNSHQRDSYSSQRKCWACHEIGHIRRNCPNVKCYHCQRPGHKRFQCYDLNPERRRFDRAAAIENDKSEEIVKEISENEYAPFREEEMGALQA